MIAENAFGVFFIITKVFLGCIWHEKKKKKSSPNLYSLGNAIGFQNCFPWGRAQNHHQDLRL